MVESLLNTNIYELMALPTRKSKKKVNTEEPSAKKNDVVPSVIKNHMEKISDTGYLKVDFIKIDKSFFIYGQRNFTMVNLKTNQTYTGTYRSTKSVSSDIY